MTAGSNAPQTRKRKGPRPKHVPQRMCISCREHSTKRALTRVVRTPEGQVVIDPTGKLNGRGAYLCDKRQCWERAISTSLLARALKTEIDSDTADLLRRHAATLAEHVDATPQVGQKG
jgi:predicted RNA-binding protein YlxR (DUF448 family)